MNIAKLKNDVRLPKHVGLIIDGNGRWAKRRGLPRSAGHKVGADNIKRQVEYCIELGIKNLSIYCFSTENWNRPKREVDYIMDLFKQAIDDYYKEYKDRDVRVIVSGNLDDVRISKELRQSAKDIIEKTKNKSGFVLNLCINYGGKQEILLAASELAKSKEEFNEQNFEKHLYTKDLLPLDFIIRTSGEERTSNFMPWQATYAELYFPKKTWPAFTKSDLIKAMKVYMSRNRRYGTIKG